MSKRIKELSSDDEDLPQRLFELWLEYLRYIDYFSSVVRDVHDEDVKKAFLAIYRRWFNQELDKLERYFFGGR